MQPGAGERLVAGVHPARSPCCPPSSCGCSRRPRPRVDAAPSSRHRRPVSPAGHPPTFPTSDKTSARFVIRKCLEMLLTYLLLGTHMIPPNSKFQAHLPFATLLCLHCTLSPPCPEPSAVLPGKANQSSGSPHALSAEDNRRQQLTVNTRVLYDVSLRPTAPRRVILHGPGQ